jgi:hypothetical protein
MFTSEITTKPLNKISLREVSRSSAVSFDRTLTIENVELTNLTLYLMFEVMDSTRSEKEKT